MTSEHDLGALVLAVAARSLDNYVLIRRSHALSRHGREWRVSVKRAGKRAEHTSTSGDSLVGALTRALVYLSGGSEHEKAEPRQPPDRITPERPTPRTAASR